MATFVLVAAIACALAVALLAIKLIGEIVIAIATTLMGEGTGEDDRAQPPAPPMHDPQSWHRLHRHHRHLEYRKARP